MAKTILLDYGAGNLHSVDNALRSLSADVEIISSGENFPQSPERIILPGVGSFGDSMQQLHARGLAEPVQEAIANNIPFLGICVGYQMLFESSEESPSVAGLGILKGKVKKFSPGKKIPHMGWNNTSLKNATHPLWHELGNEPYFYYVHSYFPEPEDSSIIAATCDYEETFASAIIKENLHAVQFHPEKSQDAGIKLLENFLKL